MKRCFDLRNERGAALVWVALMATILFGFTALVIDVGFVAQERRRMVTAADAAALAGAMELAYNRKQEAPLAEAAAIAKAESFALENGADFIDSITIETVEHNGENLKAVVARVGCNVEYTFGKLLGFEGQKVYASATAVYGFPLDGSNILPIRHDSNIELGVQVTLGNDKLAPGNWGFLRPNDGSQGESAVADIFRGRKSLSLRVQTGEEEDFAEIYTYTGKAGNQLIWGIEDRMKKVADPRDNSITMEGLIPITDEFTDVSGTTKIRVIGFAYFRLIDVITEEYKKVGGLYYSYGSEWSDLNWDR